ncbi:hypothetical protein EV586_103183 [Tumebacillus sp. BK434]|uniref:DUF1802 family protein n=1 Tax=Tumebacillus sp. BK434 TaxID=2512169 RepID=UPI0010447085|nr:DUF1802 family protein [Tumebacillus sp. BK434]TCP55530.1 hypothetical protein EV586_103183 [Tumebacillus sp. BK434]
MGIGLRSFSLELHSPHLPIKEVALKEWAVCIDAIAKGEQLVLIRKGGITEETREFRLEETSFYLYPTYEHQRSQLIKPQYQARVEATMQGVTVPPQEVVITHAAHVVDDITVLAEQDLKRLDPFHIMTHDYAAERLQWRNDKPLHILTVRAYKLTVPKTIPVAEGYLGCKSWITLQQPIVDTDLEPVLSEAAFAARRQLIFDALGITEHKK